MNTITRPGGGRAKTSAFGDAIAIVGMACRFPCAPDLAAFWRHLESGSAAATEKRRGAGPWGDLVESLPAQYAPYLKAGFVDGIDLFDERFFGISPIEARMIDPQQRMLLETSWQALEDAGIDPGGIRGSSAGVNVGISTSEYRDLMKTGDYGIGYLSTAASMAVGRLSFHFGLTGPAVPVELNCASSLVALHQAVIDLRLGTTDMALSGGVNAVLSAPRTREMADLGLLSRRGECRPFGAEADGFVRGEGCGIVVLKRHADAKAEGDRIWAVIRGTAINQNGAAAGKNLPNGHAQERVIEQALAQSGFAPAEVDYLEAHGAGSASGDCIEVQAAASVYGRNRRKDRPLLIGSVKSSIGHLESAAGIASVIKTVLAMNRGAIPGNPNFRMPSKLIAWDQLPVRVVKEAAVWPQTPARPPRSGISAFGISGVNAHIVLEGYGFDHDGSRSSEPMGPALPVDAKLPQQSAAYPKESVSHPVRGKRLLPLSGKSDDALRELAKRYLAWLEEQADQLAPEDASASLLADMAWTAGAGRSHFTHRAAIVFRDAASLRDRLAELAAAGAGTRSTSYDSNSEAKIAFAYPECPVDCTVPARLLYRTEPAARAVLDRLEAAFPDQRLDRLVSRASPDSPSDDFTWTPPAAYALACGLTALWASLGIRPDVVIGRGAGEAAALQAAGMCGLEEGMRIALASGDAETMHHAATTPSIEVVSGSTGRLLTPGEVTERERRRGMAPEAAPPERCAVTLSELSVGAIVEIGPRTSLGATLIRSMAAMSNDSGGPAYVESLRLSSGKTEEQVANADGALVAAAAAAYEAGIPVSFEGLFVGEVRRRIALPLYPFQQRSHWLEMSSR